MTHYDSVEEAIREANEIDAELVRRLEQERWRFYEPSVKGEEYINAISKVHEDGQQNFMTLYSAANGIGKTATSAVIVANILFPSENPYFQHPFYQNWKFPKRGRIASDPTNIDKNIIPTLKFWFPHEDLGRWTARKNNKNYLSEWSTDTGWDFDIMSYDQDSKEYEGPTLGWVWLDEPPPEAILKAIISRMRLGGVIFISATPLAGSAYLYDTFAAGNTKVHIVGPNGEQMIYTRPVSYIEADVWSACRDIPGTRGHLSKGDIYKMIAEYSPDEQQARIKGKFQHLVGLVFKQWNRNIHVIKPFNVNHEDYTVWHMLDPHPRNPHAVTWVAIDKYGRKFVIDELFDEVAGNTSEWAYKVKQKDAQYRVVKRIADPSAFNIHQNDADGLSFADRLSKHYGLTYEQATKQRSAADRRFQDALAYQEVAGQLIKPPEMYVFENCTRTIFEIEHYRWDEWVGRTADKKDRKQKPIDKDDHMIENIGRCLIQEPQFIHYVPLEFQNMGYANQEDDLDPFRR